MPDEISAWNPDRAPQAMMMNTNGNNDPANTGPLPLKAKSVKAAVRSGGAVTAMPMAISTMVPIFMKVDR